jgi:purine-cytosine permease-like protein
MNYSVGVTMISLCIFGCKKFKILSRYTGVLEYWSIGVLEYWSTGMLNLTVFDA